jgi:hypothetical protein
MLSENADSNLLARDYAKCFSIYCFGPPYTFLQQPCDHDLVFGSPGMSTSSQYQTHLPLSYTLDAIGLISLLIIRKPS